MLKLLLADVLPIALPILLGALIGYVTNAIAIKMLFRPLKEVRLFGVRLPFTPGIIPRRRSELAESIAKMVSQQLLTDDAVLKQVRSTAFHEVVRDHVARVTTGIMNTRFAGQQQPVQRELPELVRNVWSAIVNSPGFAEHAAALIEQMVGSMLDVQLQELRTALAAGAAPGAARSVEPVTREVIIDRIVDVLTRRVASVVHENRPLTSVVPAGVWSQVPTAVESAYKPLFQLVFRWLNRPDVRDDLNERGKRLLQAILDRLNLFQRLFVSATKYDSSLESAMPEIVDDVIKEAAALVFAPSTRQRVLEEIVTTIERLRVRGVADLLQEFSIDGEQLIVTFHDKVRLFLADRWARREWHRAVHRFLHEKAELTIADVVGELTGLSRDDVAAAAAAAVVGWAGGSGHRSCARVVSVFGRRLADQLTDRTLSDLVSLDDSRKAAFDDYVARRAIDLIAERVPGLIAAFDVHALVVNKINGLDVKAVEELLLLVIHRHLKWINLFGALLGALIGAGQFVLRAF